LYALLGAMLLFWSANFIFAKLALRELPSVFVLGLRTVCSGLLMWPVCAFARDRMEHGVKRWTWSDAPRLMTFGVLGVIGNQALFMIGLSMTSVAHGSVITAMGPMLILVGASVAGHERLSPAKITGMSVAAAGVVVMQFGRAVSGSPSLRGDLVMLVSVMVFAAYSVLGKKVAAEFGSIAVNTFAFIGGALVLAPSTLWQAWNFGIDRVSGSAWTGVVYMALFPSIAGYLIYSYALRYLPASRVSSVAYLQPLVATLLAIVFLREIPAPTFTAGAGLVLAGVYVTGRR
jgi:drug/metabolite transporter (DMT)-like permease